MKNPAARTASTFAAAILVCLIAAEPASAQPMGKSKEYRSLNTDLYKISIQKDGRLDVFLADDTPVILDVFPMVWFDGDGEPDRMKIAGRWTERLAVEDKLGQGQGVVHVHKGLEWSLRAYPTRPFFAVQLGYTNESNRPVRIKALLPWCVGEPGKGVVSLGPGTAESRVLGGTTIGVPAIARGSAQSDDAIAIVNATSGQSLIAGFITQDRARGTLDVGTPIAEEKDAPSSLGHFRAVSTFDTPVEVGPGESVYSEVLYIAIAEPDPVLGFQRYARAVRVANGRYTSAQPDQLHAWIVATSDAAQPASDLSERLRRARERVPLESISHVLIGSPEEPALQEAECRALVEAVRSTGYTPLLWRQPKPADALASSATYDFSIAGVAEVHSVQLVGNVTASRAVTQDFRTRMREGDRIVALEPSLLAGTVLDAVITRAADRHYLTPQPAPQWVLFDRNAGGRVSPAEVTSAAMLGCGLLLPLPGSDETALRDLAARVLPSPTAAARPVDLFASRHPGMFHLRTSAPDGEVHVAAIANWNVELPLSAPIPLARFGFPPGTYYTVYDFWSGRYLGTAADSLDVSVPADEAVALVFRPALGYPALAAVGANLGQNTPALRRADWDPQARTLTVERAASETGTYTIAVPPPYKLTVVESLASGKITWEAEATSATIHLEPGVPGFVARFSVNP